MTVRAPLAAAMLLVFALGGCQTAPMPNRPTATPSGADAFYGQAVSWEPCGDGLRCATVAAPIDWDSPADGSIELALVEHPATGVSQGSLLLNPGGPGGSGWDYVYGGGARSVTPAVAQVFDVVGWDPRGVGRSTPVECYTDSAETDDLLYGTFEEPYGTDGWIRELTAEEGAFAAACERNTGALLGTIDSASNARDMDMLRAVLGDEKLNYLGYSYGTYFGAVYAALFPDKVGRFVLDGAVDPLVSDFESLKFQMAGFDSALAAYLQSCLDSGVCPFSGTIDDALAQVRGILDGVDARGLVNADGRELDSATLGTAIALGLYSESSWPGLTLMFRALEQGDPYLVFGNADRYNSRNSDGTYSSNSFEVYVAATCLDGDFASDPASTLDRIAEIDRAAPILGKYFAYDDFAVLDTACGQWPFPRADLPTSFAAEGAPPIIVIGTTNDPATPYASSVSLAEQLSSGVLVSYEGERHTVYNRGVACIDDVVDDYFVTGTVPAADPLC